jgi:8-oxo-dGTP pyrophosphatase MutT (NUDIX family)
VGLSRASDEVVPPFSPGDVRRRARERLPAAPQAEAFDPAWRPRRGDHQLAPGLEGTEAQPHRPAAVLVPIVAREAEAMVLLTQRASHLRDHSGQIAFPGGKIDAEDPSPLETALREAQEEIGLSRRLVQPLGYLDPYLSGTGFRILPVVAMVEPNYELAINTDEVDAAFEVPLAFLMTETNHQRHAKEWKGSLRHYYAMPYLDRYIWGVTAGILRNLYERLYAA